MTGLLRGIPRRPATFGWAALVVVAVVLPYVFDDYQTFQFARVTTTAIALASLVLLTGWSGQVSAGHGALFGLGAYTCAILVVHQHVPWVLAVLAAGVVSLLGGLLLGLPALRLGGVNLALVTLTLAVLFPLVAGRLTVTGGPFGLVIPPVRTPGGIQLSGAQFLYLVTLAVLGLLVVLLALWTRGRTGRALVALRSNPLMARTQGVHTARLAVLTVGISGAVAGIGGALNALVVQSAIPDAYPFTLSLALLTGAVVGGIRSWAGAILGAIYVVYVPQLVSDHVSSAIAGQWSQVIYAVTLLLTLYFAPTGLAGLGRRLRSRTQRPAASPDGDPTAPPGPTETPPHRRAEAAPRPGPVRTPLDSPARMETQR
ncbi:MAG TPA: branched-chain amino acid ABC transporter permease [Micromonosporaceae bacterium]|nr:branched-chain amino acid ABC transporter permease [Micromonosporaceae bacterium]